MVFPRMTFDRPDTAEKPLSAEERKLAYDSRMKFWTSFCLTVALGSGLAMAIFHGGAVTVSIAAFGAALGLGGVLGFLFGVPSPSKSAVNIGRADSVAVGTGDSSETTGGNVGTDVASNMASKAAVPAVASEESGEAGQAGVAASMKPGTAGAGKKPGIAVSGDTGNTSGSTSNLEQVADWVTKLLLGGGLTQMQRIPPKIWQWSRMVAIGILRDTPRPAETLIEAHQAFAAGLMVYGFILGFFAGFLITKLQLGNAIAD